MFNQYGNTGGYYAGGPPPMPMSNNGISSSFPQQLQQPPCYPQPQHAGSLMQPAGGVSIMQSQPSGVQHTALPSRPIWSAAPPLQPSRQPPVTHYNNNNNTNVRPLASGGYSLLPPTSAPPTTNYPSLQPPAAPSSLAPPSYNNNTNNNNASQQVVKPFTLNTPALRSLIAQRKRERDEAAHNATTATDPTTTGAEAPESPIDNAEEKSCGDRDDDNNDNNNNNNNSFLSYITSEPSLCHPQWADAELTFIAQQLGIDEDLNVWSGSFRPRYWRGPSDMRDSKCSFLAIGGVIAKVASPAAGLLNLPTPSATPPTPALSAPPPPPPPNNNNNNNNNNNSTTIIKMTGHVIGANSGSYMMHGHQKLANGGFVHNNNNNNNNTINNNNNNNNLNAAAAVHNGIFSRLPTFSRCPFGTFVQDGEHYHLRLGS